MAAGGRMARIGVTGHVVVTADSTALVYRAIVDELDRFRGPELHGITCLADGADQIFAEAVLALGGTFDVVLPAADYRAAKVAPDRRANFDRLLARATDVKYLEFPTSGPEAFMAAGEEVVRRSDMLLAIWDGEP